MNALGRVSLRRRLTVLGFVAVFAPVVVLLVVVLATTDNTVVVGQGGAEVEVTRGPSPWVPVTAALLAVPVGLAVSWWAGRTVRPLTDVTATLDGLEAGSLDRRLGLDGAPAEVQALADSFDRLLERLARASEGERRLIEEASHDLRTPLAAAAAGVDALLADPAAPQQERRLALERVRRGLDRLAAVVEDRLADARARDALAAQRDNDLAALARRAADDHNDVARDRSVDLRVVGPDVLLAAADGEGVARAVSNLLDNALRWSPPGGRVDVEVGTEGDRAFLAVTDEGPGIALEARDQVFERYRGNGHGIGLAIVHQVANAHEGVELRSPVEPGEGGTRVTLWFRR